MRHIYVEKGNYGMDAYTSPLEGFNLSDPKHQQLLEYLLANELSEHEREIMNFRIRRPNRYPFTIKETARALKISPVDVLAAEKKLQDLLEKHGVPKNSS